MTTTLTRHAIMIIQNQPAYTPKLDLDVAAKSYPGRVLDHLGPPAGD